MADFPIKITILVERIFGMESGYVLDFSNRSFREFILHSIQKDIYEQKYEYESNSKANRLRKLFHVEDDYLVIRLLSDLLEYGVTKKVIHGSDEDLSELRKYVASFNSRVVQIDVMSLEDDNLDATYKVLIETIKKTLESKEYEFEIDRLHTFVVKFLRLCLNQNGLTVDEKKPIHSLLGEYFRVKRQQMPDLADFSDKFLRHQISLFEELNNLRNHHSLAHDTRLISRDIAELMFSQILQLIIFIRRLETTQPPKDIY